MKFKNYVNKYTGDNRIYSLNDITQMALGDVLKNKEELLSQYRELGVPSDAELQSSENVVYVHAYTRDDGTEVKSHYRSKPDGIMTNNLTTENKIQEDGTLTGSAVKVDRKKELSVKKELPKNNNDFFEKERNNPQSVLMRVNGERNAARPDAKLFMDIALVGPKNVPSTQDYQFISSKKIKR